MAGGPTSHLHHLPPAPRVTMETPLAHMLQLLLPKPSPHKLCASALMLFIFSAPMFVYFACGMYSVCCLSMYAHAHHLGHKVSSVHGTWVLWFEGSSLWSARWWPWSNRQSSSEILIIFRQRLFWVTIHLSVERPLSLCIFHRGSVLIIHINTACSE